MNYYFLLEDSQSFIKVLPEWLKYMNFGCTRVVDIQSVEKNNYVMQSGQGIVQLITKALFDTINTIKQNPGKIDYLVVILDSEDLCVQERKEQVIKKIEKEYPNEQFDFKIKIFVCNHCFETWLLGANGIYPDEAVEKNSYFYPYYKHYDISKDDPEDMTVPDELEETTAKYHFHYLHELFRYKKIRYRKSNINHVKTEEYFRLIVERIQTTSHVRSFNDFFSFFYKDR